MARIDVNLSELKAAFNNFRKHAPDAKKDKCCCLDALYAAECGISAVLLRERKETSTRFIKTASHDINALLKLCHMPPGFYLPSRITLAENRSVACHSISHTDLHSALRYGAKMPDAQWKKCAEILAKLFTWIDENLKGR